MADKSYLGEFEQMVLLAILQLKDDAHAPAVTTELESSAGRTVSQGALYTVLKRLEQKGLVRWSIESATSERGGYPKRRFEVTGAGIEALTGFVGRAVDACARSRRGSRGGQVMRRSCGSPAAAGGGVSAPKPPQRSRARLDPRRLLGVASTPHAFSRDRRAMRAFGIGNRLWGLGTRSLMSRAALRAVARRRTADGSQFASTGIQWSPRGHPGCDTSEALGADGSAQAPGPRHGRRRGFRGAAIEALTAYMRDLRLRRAHAERPARLRAHQRDGARLPASARSR